MITRSVSNNGSSFIPERLDTRAPLHDLLHKRWSPRSLSAAAIEPWKIVSLFEAARWSPSSANEQPWHFIVATQADADAHRALSETLSVRNRLWASSAPMLVLAVAQSLYSASGRPNRHALYDLGQSVAHLTVQASALGLAVHQIGGFEVDKARELFSIPDGYEPVVVLAIGYVDRPERLPDDLRQREEMPRSRKPLEVLVFTEKWGIPSHHIAATHPLLNDLPPSN